MMNIQLGALGVAIPAVRAMSAPRRGVTIPQQAVGFSAGTFLFTYDGDTPRSGAPARLRGDDGRYYPVTELVATQGVALGDLALSDGGIVLANMAARDAIIAAAPGSEPTVEAVCEGQTVTVTLANAPDAIFAFYDWEIDCHLNQNRADKTAGKIVTLRPSTRWTFGASGVSNILKDNNYSAEGGRVVLRSEDLSARAIVNNQLTISGVRGLYVYGLDFRPSENKKAVDIRDGNSLTCSDITFDSCNLSGAEFEMNPSDPALTPTYSYKTDYESGNSSAVPTPPNDDIGNLIVDPEDYGIQGGVGLICSSPVANFALINCDFNYRSEGFNPRVTEGYGYYKGCEVRAFYQNGIQPTIRGAAIQIFDDVEVSRPVGRAGDYGGTVDGAHVDWIKIEAPDTAVDYGRLFFRGLRFWGGQSRGTGNGFSYFRGAYGANPDKLGAVADVEDSLLVMKSGDGPFSWPSTDPVTRGSVSGDAALYAQLLADPTYDMAVDGDSFTATQTGYSGDNRVRTSGVTAVNEWVVSESVGDWRGANQPDGYFLPTYCIGTVPSNVDFSAITSFLDIQDGGGDAWDVNPFVATEFQPAASSLSEIEARFEINPAGPAHPDQSGESYAIGWTADVSIKAPGLPPRAPETPSVTASGATLTIVADSFNLWDVAMADDVGGQTTQQNLADLEALVNTVRGGLSFAFDLPWPTSVDVDVRKDGGDWATVAAVPVTRGIETLPVSGAKVATLSTSVPHSGPGTYEVRLRQHNRHGAGAWSEPGVATVV